MLSMTMSHIQVKIKSVVLPKPRNLSNKRNTTANGQLITVMLQKQCFRFYLVVLHKQKLYFFAGSYDKGEGTKDEPCKCESNERIVGLNAYIGEWIGIEDIQLVCRQGKYGQ